MIKACPKCGVGVMWRNGHPVQYHDCEEDRLEASMDHSIVMEFDRLVRNGGLDRCKPSEVFRFRERLVKAFR